MSKRLKVVRQRLEEAAARMRSSAMGLQGEVDRGVALRQSIESKESRIQVLNACADELNEIARSL